MPPAEVAERAARHHHHAGRVKAAPAISGERGVGHQDPRDLGAVYGSDAGCRRRNKIAMVNTVVLFLAAPGWAKVSERTGPADVNERWL